MLFFCQEMSQSEAETVWSLNSMLLLQSLHVESMNDHLGAPLLTWRQLQCPVRDTIFNSRRKYQQNNKIKAGV